MKRYQHPHEAGRYFFQALMQNQCQVCWQLFSDKTQKEFITWTLRDMYQQHPKAAQAAKLGPPEVKLMFETNTLDLLIRFWRRFVQQSNAIYFHRYGYFDTVENTGKVATVNVKLDYENGRVDQVMLKMFNERGGWRLGYLESGLPF